MAEKSLLIVDDDPNACETLFDIFEDKGYSVATANTASDAINKAKETDFNAALIDIKLPDMEGTALLKELKKISPEIVYCIITGYASLQNAIESLKDGAAGYFIKPLVIEEVVHRLEDALDKQRLQQELRESEERYRGLVEQTVDAVVGLDLDANIVSWNKGAEDLFGYQEDKIIGQSHTVIVSEDYKDSCVENFREVTIKGFLKEAETLRKAKDGRLIHVAMSLAVVNNSKGEHIGYVSILRDITERKQAEEKLKEEMELTTNLLMIAEATARTTEIDKLIEQVAHSSCRIIGCDICLIYLWDKETGVFRPSQSCGLPHEMVPLFRTELLNDKVEFVRRVLKGKEPVVEEYRADTNALNFIKGIQTMAVIPLIAKNQYLGLIIGFYKGTKELTERDRKILYGLSHQVSTALEEARLYKDSLDKTLKLSHKIKTIQVIHEIDRSILSVQAPQEILETVTRMVAKIIPCDRAIVALIDKEKQCFIYAAGFGVNSLTKKAHVPFAETSTTEVIKTGRPQYMANLEEAKGLLPLEKKFLEEGFLSHLRVPLIVKGQPIGTLNIGAKRPFAYTSDDLATLEKLASQISVALENARLLTDLQELFIGTLKALSEAIDAKSSWTKGHSDRVTRFALDIGTKMELDEKAMKDLELAGLLHDIGKIGTFELILNKPGSLTEEEMNIMKQHPSKGAEILSPIKQLKNIIPALKHHHEFYDGTGYPDGLKEEEIPLMARILAVADTFDSMTAERPYRKTPGHEKAVEELKRCSGTQFDPKVVEAFLKIVEKR